jgi:hypothetical protein
MGIGQSPQTIEFFIWPADAVFSDGDAVQPHLDGLLNELFRGDD